MITTSFGWFSGCDLAMPHDMRYDSSDIRHHPPNCPARPVIRIAELEEMLTAATDTAMQRGYEIDQLRDRVEFLQEVEAHVTDLRVQNAILRTALDGADGG